MTGTPQSWSDKFQIRPIGSAKPDRLAILAVDGIRTVADFGGRTIAVTCGSTAHLDAQSRKPETARIAYFERQENAIQDLFSGRIDAFGTGDICGHHVVAQHADRLAVSDVHETDTPEHFAFAVEETSDLVAPLNTFIRKNSERYPTAPAACEWSDYQI